MIGVSIRVCLVRVFHERCAAALNFTMGAFGLASIVAPLAFAALDASMPVHGAGFDATFAACAACYVALALVASVAKTPAERADDGDDDGDDDGSERAERWAPDRRGRARGRDSCPGGGRDRGRVDEEGDRGTGSRSSRRVSGRASDRPGADGGLHGVERGRGGDVRVVDIHRGSSARGALRVHGGCAHVHVLGVFHRHEVRAGASPGPAPATALAWSASRR